MPFSLPQLPLIPLRQGVVFPHTTVPLPVGRDKSIALARAVSPGDSILLAMQRDGTVEDPGIADLLPIAVLGRVKSVIKARGGLHHLVVEARRRVRLLSLASSHPFWRGNADEVDEHNAHSSEAIGLAGALLETLRGAGAALSEDIAKRLQKTSVSREPGVVADLVAAAMGTGSDKELKVLLELDVEARLRAVHELFAEVVSMAEVKSKIDREVHQELAKNQREALLRQRLAAIKKELGESDSGESSLAERLDAIELPEDIRKVTDRELKRLEAVGQSSPEHQVITRYLELIADLPWDKRADVKDDIEPIERALDADHYGLDDVKKRILEHLAVAKLTGDNRGAILSLVGPPGVGKTSLGQSIADATGRPFVRVSLGGVRDEAEIRGHRRTYVGALPGRILAAIRRAGAKNPVVLLDEIDKLGQGWMGSPEAALLEVLDPEQNSTFTDHYLELPFDLSEVLFICTANSLSGMSSPLRDRLEIIEIDGYTHQEKRHIALEHLWPKSVEKHGLTTDVATISDAAIDRLIHDYTRESGVRQLGRELGRLCRSITLEVARQSEGAVRRTEVDESEVVRILGKAKFHSEVAERTSIPGIATGMAWTPVGGDILFVETSRMSGKGRLEITGQLGDVMKESARAALTYVRSHAAELGVSTEDISESDVHVHVPAGAVPKDGPSAGVTIFTALTSLFTGRRVRSDTSMTGECTLRGRVLPVGGIKAKVLAAHRAGLKRIILPERNRRDIDDIPEVVRGDLEFIFATDMSDVLHAALEIEPAAAVGADPSDQPAAGAPV